ncbi:hypothetical protein [Hyalangium versicolor]|uniref:hypothetical protein n=1 Tax=Hyalangium versicolor TaxID=2861190 RepID=UPI001CCED046|nr:hypothetical protein [Hyalangium versicolor]
MATRTLYRPVGLKEAELVLGSECTGFPPRLPDQPIFYPVMNDEYARQIARGWNTPDPGSGYAGFITEFDVSTAYLEGFEVHTVGGGLHKELWVPAEQLAEFNRRISGPIRFTEAHYGPRYRGPETTLGAPLAGQLRTLRSLEPGAVKEHRALVLFNFAWWSQTPADAQGLSEAEKFEALDYLRRAWVKAFSRWPLPVPSEPATSG